MKIDKKTQLTIAYVILTVLLLISLNNYFSAQVNEVSYSEFRQWVEGGMIEECSIGMESIRGLVRDGGETRSFATVRVEDPGLVELLEENQVKFAGQNENTFLTQLLSWILPAVVFVGIWMFMARRMGGGSGGLMSIGKSKAKVYMEKGTGITFEDVAGIDEAKEELQEVVEFLETPERFQALGGRIPRGVLLVGPPRDGKNPACQGGGRRGGGPLLFDQRFRFRRNVRGGRCGPSPRSF